MPSALRDGIRVALNRPRIFGVAALVLAVGLGLRLALAVVHPVLSVLCPPVVAAPLLGAVAPATRDAVANPDADAAPQFRTRLRECGSRLLGIAVAGHLVALLLGAAAFLLVDTAVRATVYAAGGSLPIAVVYVAPLAGVATGTLLAWSLLAPAVARATGGATVCAAARAPLRALCDRRRTALALGLHVACVLVGAGVLVTGLTLAPATYATRSAALRASFVLVALVAATVGLLGLFAYPIHVALAREYALPTRTPSARSLALAALLVVGLVAGASAARVTETRPTDAVATAPLPENATDAYAEAIDRTGALDHRVAARERVRGETVAVTYTLERSTRQYRTSTRTDGRVTVGYADSGVTYGLSGGSQRLFALGERDAGAGSSALAFPGYWPVRDDYRLTRLPVYSLPRAGTGAWTTVERGNGTRTLELTGGPAVSDALHGGEAPNGDYEAARVRIRVDTDRGVVTGGSARLNATVDSRPHVRNVTYDVRTGRGVDARRPDALGARSLGEWVWDLFAY